MSDASKSRNAPAVVFLLDETWGSQYKVGVLFTSTYADLERIHEEVDRSSRSTYFIDNGDKPLERRLAIQTIKAMIATIKWPD